MDSNSVLLASQTGLLLLQAQPLTMENVLRLVLLVLTSMEPDVLSVQMLSRTVTLAF